MVIKSGLSVYQSEQITQRHNLVQWIERQGHGPEMISEMSAMMDEFPDSAKTWLQPQDWGTATASFVNHHILLAAKK